MADLNELTTPIDRVSKLLFREYADLLVRLAFPGQTVRIVNVEENIEINLPTRPVDMVMTIATGGEAGGRELGLHVEYYARHEANVPQTLFIYSGELTDRMKMPVATVVIYSERRRPELRPAPEYVVAVGQQVVNRFVYHDLWLMDYAEQIEAGELAPLAPFLVEFTPEPTEATVELAKSLAYREPDVERRSLLLSFVVLLAARYFDRETIRRLFRTEVEMVRTNTFIDEWLEEAEQRGLKVGREEGREEGHHEVVLYILNRRFDAVPEELTLRIKKLSLEHLITLLDAVQTAESLSAVEEALGAIEQSISAGE